MRVLWITLVTIVIDQITKVIVVRNMYHSQSIDILGDWLKFTYTENPGMAFGIAFGPPSMISIFSIIATTLIMIYLFKVRNGYAPYRWSIGLVLGGALGNIVDWVAYGKIFYDNPLFQGRVVDFIHVDAWRGMVPEWIPFMGGKMMALFPIWNVADMAIVAGVVGILTFQKKFHDLLAEAHETGDLENEADGATTEATNSDVVTDSSPVDGLASPAVVKPADSDVTSSEIAAGSPTGLASDTEVDLSLDDPASDSQSPSKT